MGIGLIGIVANPASGKDIRRLVAHASVFDNNEKRNMVRRALLGAIGAGATEFIGMPTPARLVEDAFEGLEDRATLRLAEVPGTASQLDTTRAAMQMRDASCAVVLTFGGDGTNRAFAKGWLGAPLIPVSTGTNNVFPRMMEATVAGAAAGLIATGAVAADEVSRPSKRIQVRLADGREDVALIDAVHLDERFIGARAVWVAETIRTFVLARAEPDVVGLSAVGGLLHPVSDDADEGLLVEAGEGGGGVRAPIAPGLYSDVPIRRSAVLALGEPVTVPGPGTIALDGEREVVLKPGETAELRVLRDGPCVIAVPATLRLGACRGVFMIRNEGASDGD
ncbi:MAG: NAD(+)/NADH kinase [Dehalococcoidia bacterium]|nr:NAD(+)/NADH kinase [Dehalococcoidia bacterium]